MRGCPEATPGNKTPPIGPYGSMLWAHMVLFRACNARAHQVFTGSSQDSLGPYPVVLWKGEDAVLGIKSGSVDAMHVSLTLHYLPCPYF